MSKTCPCLSGEKIAEEFWRKSALWEESGRHLIINLGTVFDRFFV
jgi:hypothetical protein